MAKLIFSPRAERDLQEIGDWNARDNPERAVSFVADIVETCRTLLQFPRRFRTAPQFGPDAHCCPYGNYRIYYDVLIDAVEIITIIHAARSR